MNQDTFSKDFRAGESVSRASWRTRRISLTFATSLIRMMAWDSNHNSLTRKKELFQPLVPGRVGYMFAE